MNWNKFLPCILLSSLLGACSGKGEQPNVEPITLCLTDSLLRIVSVDTVHVRDVIDELTLNGRVTFNQDQVANVYPMFGGTVTELHAEIGDFVHKGEVLAVIRSGEVADYEKQLKEAEQQLLLARRNMNATQDMYTSGMASDKDVLQAKQELTSAEAEERRIKEIFSKVYHLLDSESKTMSVRIKLKNEDYLLKPGMFTNVTVKCKAEDTSMPRIDSHALVFEGGKNYVVVVEPDQHPMLPVKVFSG